MKQSLIAIAAVTGIAFASTSFAAAGEPRDAGTAIHQKGAKSGAQRSVRAPAVPESAGAGKIDEGKVVFF